MFNGAHLLVLSRDPEADRAFLRDVLGFASVDAGHGWLIFGLSPAELAIHPSEAGAPAASDDGGLTGAHLYLMCDDLSATVAALAAKGVSCGPVEQARWGSLTSIPLPSGGALGLYQPRHPTALGLAAFR
ncbi:MAG TPA: VOC family protein [Thermoanaerobaculia bacterium]